MTTCPHCKREDVFTYRSLTSAHTIRFEAHYTRADTFGAELCPGSLQIVQEENPNARS